jgi:hypothetical protein
MSTYLLGMAIAVATYQLQLALREAPVLLEVPWYYLVVHLLMA